MNCGEGPAQALRIAPRDGGRGRRGADAARPNAGGPARSGRAVRLPGDAGVRRADRRARSWRGAAIVGGCCGVGPAHIAAIAAGSLAAPTLGRRGRRTVRRPGATVAPAAPGTDRARTRARRPRVPDHRRDGAAAIVQRGAVGRRRDHLARGRRHRDRRRRLADGEDADERLGRLPPDRGARGIETVLHFPTRGRNLVRLQGDLLGAHALGIGNLFVCVGDPVTVGDYPQAPTTWTSPRRDAPLVTEQFNEGVDRAGSSIGEPTAFYAGAALAPTAPDLDREVRLTIKKVRAGARFVLTQPLYDASALTRVPRGVRAARPASRLAVPVLAGVLPPVSVRNADFLHNEVPGIVIPAGRAGGAGRRDDLRRAWRASLGIVGELAAALRGAGAAGCYVVPQFGRYDRAAEVVEAAIAAVRSVPRPARPGTMETSP